MKDCLFCQIVKGEIPATKIHETTNTLAFLDISPINPGHTLIIPKEHYENIFEVPDSVLTEVAKEAKLIGTALRKATGAMGITIIIRNNEVAGQVVPHSHTHVIPRHLNDGYKSWSGKKYPEGEIEKTAERIKNEL